MSIISLILVLLLLDSVWLACEEGAAGATKAVERPGNTDNNSNMWDVLVWDSSEGRNMQFTGVQGNPGANTTQETSGA